MLFGPVIHLLLIVAYERIRATWESQMKERQGRILEIIRNKVIRQVGLHERDMTKSVAPILNPHNNNLDDLEDIDDVGDSLPSYDLSMHAGTSTIPSQYLVEQGDNDIGVLGDQSKVRYHEFSHSVMVE